MGLFKKRIQKTVSSKPFVPTENQFLQTKDIIDLIEGTIVELGNKTVGTEQNVFFDIDDTMVMHVHDNSPTDLVLYNDMMECNIGLNIHHEHVKQIKSHKNRGFSVFVWSGNGSAWAKKVIEALELQNYVDYYMTKPVKFFDDLPAEQVLVNRVYLPYKKSVD